MPPYNKSNNIRTNMFQAPCIDVYPKKVFTNKSESNKFKAVFQKNAIWKSGSKGKISITFGTFNGGPSSGISPDAAWSHIGSQSTDQFPSMNLGFIDPPYEDFEYNGVKYLLSDFKNDTRNYCNASVLNTSGCWDGWVPGSTVIHEFCHALGMLHEHQNGLFDSNSINLNKQAVYDYYRNVLGATDNSMAEVNVIDRYECNSNECEYIGSPFDLKSIMLYYIDDAWIVGGKDNNPTYPNFILSDVDKEWLQKQYPIDNPNMPEITVSFVDDNPPKWKQAWVEKMIRQELEPIIGIKFNFINTIGGSEKMLPKRAVKITTMAPTGTQLPDSTAFPTTEFPTTEFPTVFPTEMPTFEPTIEDDNSDGVNIAEGEGNATNKKLGLGKIIAIILGTIILIAIIYILFKSFGKGGKGGKGGRGGRGGRSGKGISGLTHEELIEFMNLK